MHPVGGKDLHIHQASDAQGLAVLGLCECPRDAPGPERHVLLCCLVQIWIGHHIGDGKTATGPKHSGRLGQDCALVSGQVDDAVGDDHVHAAVLQRDRLQVAFQELGILYAGLPGTGSGQLHHLCGHVQPDCPSGRTDPAG